MTVPLPGEYFPPAGITSMGSPGKIVLDLARLAKASVFVETGTYQGGATRWAAEPFPTVFTIERAEVLYLQQRDALARLPGVTPLLGDSRSVLPTIVAGLGDQRAVHWLDGHWSGGETAGADDECPLDDLARLFLCAPPLPHRAAAWPTLPEIVDALSGPGGMPFIQVVDDVLFAIPDREPLRSCLVDHAQARSGEFWRDFKRASGRPRGRLRTALSRMTGPSKG